MSYILCGNISPVESLFFRDGVGKKMAGAQVLIRLVFWKFNITDNKKARSLQTGLRI